VLASIAGPFVLGLETAMFTGGRNDRMRVLYDFKDFTSRRTPSAW